MSDSQTQTLTDALAQLRSEDELVRNEGVAASIRIGAPAVPELLPLLDERAGRIRELVMYTLSQIALPSTAPAFQQGLQDENERVRAYAAAGLAQINHSDALNASLQTLNDAPDLLHADMTPAVLTLGQMGLKAVPPLLNLLMADDEITRLRAQRALETIVNRGHGFEFGRGFPSPEKEAQARAEWKSNGDYHYSADAATRAAAVEKWRDWLRKKEQ
jgi:HEAT repeat protein